MDQQFYIWYYLLEKEDILMLLTSHVLKKHQINNNYKSKRIVSEHLHHKFSLKQQTMIKSGSLMMNHSNDIFKQKSLNKKKSCSRQSSRKFLINFSKNSSSYPQSYCDKMSILTPRTNAFNRISASVIQNNRINSYHNKILVREQEKRRKLKTKNFLGQLQNKKNQILQQLKNNQMKILKKAEESKLISQREACKREFSRQVQQIIPNLDKICLIFNNISPIMIEFKVHFRTTMFLLYKIYRERRIHQYHKIKQISKCIDHQTKEITAKILSQNEEVTNYVDQMLAKLKQSKKWKLINEKQLFQNFQCNKSERNKLVVFTVKKVIKTINELYIFIMDNSQYALKLIEFGCSTLYLILQWTSLESKNRFLALTRTEAMGTFSIDNVTEALTQLVIQFQNDCLL